MDARIERTATADGSLPPRSTERLPTRGEITRAITAAVRGAEMELDVPGRHYSGLTYNELLAILAAQGRDFGYVNKTMRHAVLADLLARYEDSRRMPTQRDLRTAISAAAVAWVVKRLEWVVRDVRIRGLTDRYRERKAKDGFGDNPIGVRTGALRDRVESAGRMRVTL